MLTWEASIVRFAEGDHSLVRRVQAPQLDQMIERFRMVVPDWQVHRSSLAGLQTTHCRQS
jgi:hypothetical protein